MVEAYMKNRFNDLEGWRFVVLYFLGALAFIGVYAIVFGHPPAVDSACSPISGCSL